MSAIDPTSPRESGYDTCGVPRSLGEIDSDGVFVGYICEQGTTWESRREHDEAVTAGRYMDAWNHWNRSGGVLGAEPDPEDFADAIASPENFLFALSAAREALADFMPGGIFHAGARYAHAYIAKMN